jgi:hypothetical protein
LSYSSRSCRSRRFTESRTILRTAHTQKRNVEDILISTECRGSHREQHRGHEYKHTLIQRKKSLPIRTLLLQPRPFPTVLLRGFANSLVCGMDLEGELSKTTRMQVTHEDAEENGAHQCCWWPLVAGTRHCEVASGPRTDPRHHVEPAFRPAGIPTQPSF